MNVWGIIRHFNYSQLWELFFLAIKYPVYVYPTLKATVQSFKIAKDEFPETHDKNGKGNAFRHAIWNVLICFECYKVSKDRRRIIAWAKLITDKHEQLSPNKPIDERMDLHNNRIGRNLFISSSFTSIEEISKSIKVRLANAKKIELPDDSKLHPIDLIYIGDY